jgi:EAL domain-containing protein (putative c-di-GMP-specific phosphodiesterase class I)/PAS domain-containing protein
MGPPRSAIGFADLPTYFRGEGGEDLLALVKDAANADASEPRMARVTALEPGPTDPLLLTLYGVAPGLVIGVLSDGSNAPSGTDYAVSALRMVWDGLVEGIAVAAREPGGQVDRIVGANGAFSNMFALSSPESVVGQPLAHFLAPLTGGGFAKRVEEEVVGEGRTIADLTMVLKGREGDRSLLDWEVGPVRAQDGRVLGVIAVVRDAAQSQRTLPTRKRSDLDLSSGLPNQLHFLSRLERSVERAAQARAYTFAILGLEMQGLRAVERRLGTLVANTALEALVRRLEQRLRPTDLVARTGDRRLAILLDHFAPWGALDDVLERIRQVTDAPYTIAGEHMTMSAIGAPGPIWSGEDPPIDAQEVLRELEVAVGRAKAAPSHRRPATRSRARSNGEVGELSNAVQKGQLQLRYLPLISLEDGRLMGLEALVRWSRPKHGIMPGRAFIRHAEQHGLIGPIGQWVWREALAHIEEWDAKVAPDLVPPVHLNLSSTEFWSPDLVSDLGRRVGETSIAASRLRLEVPESAVARRPSAAHAILEDLAESGFEAWLDRFGEGGTQLRALDSLPFHHVKLIPSIAWSSNGNADRPRAILRSLLALGHDLGWRVAVAGVETRSQAETLRSIACDVAQGFFYHGLLDASQAAALMRQSKYAEVPWTAH